MSEYTRVYIYTIKRGAWENLKEREKDRWNFPSQYFSFSLFSLRQNVLRQNSFKFFPNTQSFKEVAAAAILHKGDQEGKVKSPER